MAQPLIVREPQRKPLAAAALRTFFNVAQRWNLSIAEQMNLLGVVSRSTYFKWRKDPDSASPPKDTLERISYLLGIFKALQILLPDERAADAWLRRANRARLFGGSPALERMLGGNVSDLYVVRQYLDAQRGGWT